MKTRTLLLFLLIISSSTLFTGCSYYAYEADLEVTVKGLLSGNPRDGVVVQLFRTRQDAEDLYDPLTPAVRTNEWGEVFIIGLDPGVEYFVRVDGLLQRNIKGTGKMRSGTNTCTVRLL